MKEMVNGTQLILRVCAKTGFHRLYVKRAFDALLEEVLMAIESGESIKIRGFGTFSVQRNAGGSFVNPYTGRKERRKPRNYVRFKPGNTLKEVVNRITIQEQEE